MKIDYREFDDVDKINRMDREVKFQMKLIPTLLEDQPLHLIDLIDDTDDEFKIKAVIKSLKYLRNNRVTLYIRDIDGTIFWGLTKAYRKKNCDRRNKWDSWNKDELENMSVWRAIPKNVRYQVLQNQNWKCNICCCNLIFSKYSKPGGKVAHIDHIHPYTDACDYPNGRGMINEMTNLQALCPDCNLRKGKGI